MKKPILATVGLAGAYMAYCYSNQDKSPPSRTAVTKDKAKVYAEAREVCASTVPS